MSAVQLTITRTYTKYARTRTRTTPLLNGDYKNSFITILRTMTITKKTPLSRAELPRDGAQNLRLSHLSRNHGALAQEIVESDFLREADITKIHTARHSRKQPARGLISMRYGRTTLGEMSHKVRWCLPLSVAHDHIASGPTNTLEQPGGETGRHL